MSQGGFPGWFDWLTFVAILGGPIIAVLVTRYIDARRELQQRRFSVFRTLMATRRSTLSLDHVGSLNLVEVEFDKIPTVMAALKDLLKHYNHAYPQDGPVERQEAWAKTAADLLTVLLHSMAKELGYSMEQLDILNGGYSPKGWGDVELEQRVLRTFLIQLLEGKRAIPVAADPRMAETAEEAIHLRQLLAAALDGRGSITVRIAPGRD